MTDTSVFTIDVIERSRWPPLLVQRDSARVDHPGAHAATWKPHFRRAPSVRLASSWRFCRAERSATGGSRAGRNNRPGEHALADIPGSCSQPLQSGCFIRVASPVDRAISHIDPKALVIAYLDPAKPSLHWTTVEYLARRFRFIDFIINLPFSGIHRSLAAGGDERPRLMLNHPNPGELLHPEEGRTAQNIRDWYD